MARKKTPGLTDAELRLMEVLWRAGPATVNDVADALPKDPALAYSTVLTTLRILETKGYLKHTKDGRAFLYEAVVPREEACESAVLHLLRRFFENSPELLVLNLIDAKKISAKELKRLRRRIEEAQQ
jgi:predicted transcriptional regulator